MKHFYLSLLNIDLKPDMSLRRKPVGFLKPPKQQLGLSNLIN